MKIQRIYNIGKVIEPIFYFVLFNFHLFQRTNSCSFFTLREEILNLISSFLLLVALFKLIIFIILKLLYLKVIDVKEAYWLIPNNVLINMLKTDPNGLSSIEASFRLSKLGNNRLDTKRKFLVPISISI